MTDRIQETKAALIDRLAENAALFRALNPGDRYRVAQAAVNHVFELLGIEEVRAEVRVVEQAPEELVERELKWSVAHEIAKTAPIEVARRPLTVDDRMKAVRRLRASALAITKEIDQ